MYKYIIIFCFLFSCSYPDIDSVPNFSNIDLTKEESIDLCDFTYADNIGSKLDCYKKIEDDFKLKEITELCKSKYSDIILVDKCINEKILSKK